MKPLRSHHYMRFHGKPSKGVLDGLIDPIDRLSETVFSILILMTFTMAFRISHLFHGTEQTPLNESTNELLIGALWAVFAWGVIDGMMYALFSLFERGQSHRLLKNIQGASNEQEAVEVISDELDYILEPISEENVRQKLYRNVLEHLRDSQPRKISLNWEDLTGALAHVLVALIAVLPSLAPLFLLRNDYELSIRFSNLISSVVLFYSGYHWGKYTGGNPWFSGLLLMSVALIMVLIAILWGG